MQTTETLDSPKTRYVKSYAARLAYKSETQYPPEIPGVRNAIDVHCHAHEGQQDALALAKYASRNGMSGILYKTITGRNRPARTCQRLRDELIQWCESEKISPVTCWAGYMTDCAGPPSAQTVRDQLQTGVKAVWMPVTMHANTLSKVGFLDNSRKPNGALPWEEALKVGHYLLDNRGRLKQEIREIMRIVADCEAALFFGHATHLEIFAMAEEVDKLGFKRAVVDHPFSPFVDLSVEQMQRLAHVGIYLNFTYDELSPLLGVDPYTMYQAIRILGPEHVILSSDGGDPLFPNSVECIRLIRAYMQAFGLSDKEIHQVSTVNPGTVVGAGQRGFSFTQI